MHIERAFIKAVEGRCAWNDVAGLAGVRRYYGRTMNGNAPGDVIPGGQKVAATWHVRRLLRKGDLLPMDEETAMWAGVPLVKAVKKSKKTEID
ncbi:MAG: hypothetical protein KKC50_08380 [Candidatus Omnitrophica bacterium]|nr:hypothetical protein [Candidatus Omnitrophota bacterium]MBU1008447.1 hypothetical protein [Candidatus Dependentiae bacterium]